MKVLNIHVTSVSIRQQDRELLRDTKNSYMKVLSIHVTSVSIRQQTRDILRDTNNLNTKIKDVKFFRDKSDHQGHLTTHKGSKHKLSKSSSNTPSSSTEENSTEALSRPPISCIRKHDGCPRFVDKYFDEYTAICSTCVEHMATLQASSPFPPSLCPCCHEPSSGVDFSLCAGCIKWIHEDGFADSDWGSWTLDRNNGEIKCIQLDFTIL